MARNSMDLFSLLPTSHNYYSGVIPSIPSIMASERLNLPPVPSTVASCTLSTPLSLPPLGGGVVHPLRGRRSLGMRTTAATLIVVVVVVLLSY